MKTLTTLDTIRSRGRHIGLPLLATLFLAACSEDSDPVVETGRTLTATASLPDNVATLGRALPGGATGLTLHYTAAKDNALTPFTVITDSIDVDEESARFSFSTGPALVWEQVAKDTDGNSTFYLTAEDSKGAPMWASASSQHGATNIAFGQMQYRKAAFTLNINLTGNLKDSEKPAFTATMKVVPAAETANVTRLEWPTTNGNAASLTFDAGETIYLAPQTLADATLTIEAESLDKTWEIDLNTVDVVGGEEGQKAHQFLAGQSLTLTVRLSLTQLNTGSIEITDFTAATTGYTSELGSTTNPGYIISADGKTYTVTNRYGLQAWLDAYAENSLLEIVVDIPDESTQNIDILLPESFRTDDEKNYPVGDDGNTWAGKTWRNIVYLNSDGNVTIATATDVDAVNFAAQTAYDRGVSLVLTGDNITRRVYLDNSIAPTGSIDLILPDVTVLPEVAFNSCLILRSVSAPKAKTVGESAFQDCTGLAAVDLPVATEIGNNAFQYCIALKSLEFPSVTTLGDGVFNRVPLTSLTFSSVVTSMGHTLGLNDAESCVLTLAAGQKQMELDNTNNMKPTDEDVTAAGPTASEAARTWANKTWKEIIITPSTNE